MREIKFRGKKIENGEWSYGDLIPGKAITITGLRSKTLIGNREIVTETVGQYTGLKDKKGVEIYEGDIFSMNEKFNKIVKFIDDRAAFCVANIEDMKHRYWLEIWQQPSPIWWTDFKREIEVIGNIYDNPELLTTKQ
jgi:uncharacterized phage protein (TIGR01671 family)